MVSKIQDLLRQNLGKALLFAGALHYALTFVFGMIGDAITYGAYAVIAMVLIKLYSSK
ncbi:hypothetical protein EVB91_142 [Rhizobium phage RHph_I1_18]|nr:hypothetical protein EVB91_142 [Rhizobium phage RHph_I1_18]